MDLHTAVNLAPIFESVDVNGQFWLCNNAAAAVTRVLYEDEAVDVDSIASGWSNFSLPSKPQWRSISHKTFVAPLPDGLENPVMVIQNISKDHYAPECTLKLRDQREVITTYEALTKAYKETMTDGSHRRVKDFVDMKPEVYKSASEKN